MSKEIIELLEKALSYYFSECDIADERFLRPIIVKNHIDQALVLLHKAPEPKKQYLPSELIEDNNFVCQKCHHVHEMGGYKAVKQPLAGEFTKELRTRIIRYRKIVSPFAQDTISILYHAEQDCDRLDTLEASRKDLLAACEVVKIRIAFIGLLSEPMNENGPDWSKEIALLEAAITKAKKEG